jgi:HEAT repeat protein
LNDPRSLDLAFKYARPGNPTSLRSAAFSILGEAGKRDPRTLELLTAALKEPSPMLVFGAVQALARLGDPRAIPALESLQKSPPAGIPEGFARMYVGGLINQLKSSKTPDVKN